MKRLKNIYSKIYDINNLRLAAKKASKGKRKQYGVKLFKKDPEPKLAILSEILKNKMYKTSPYTTFFVYEPKQREVFRLPFFPDRIAHWAIMNYLEEMFVRFFTKDTYSCIKKRGIHACSFALRESLTTDVLGTQFYLQIDIKKFYENVDHVILKALLRRKIKDPDLLWLLDEIIDSAPGLPIGNLLSQYLANFYLGYFDHYVKEQLKEAHYFRYLDDMVFLAPNKPHLHQLLVTIRQYLGDELKLQIKDNYRIAPVEAQGINVVGYVHFHTHTTLRPSIAKKCRKKLTKIKNPRILTSCRAAYKGWLQHADCYKFRLKYKIAA